MNKFLVVDTVRLNPINRFVLTGAVREGFIVAGMRAFHPSTTTDTGLEIMKVELIEKGAANTEHHIAVLLRLDDIVAGGLSKREFWIGKEIYCQ